MPFRKVLHEKLIIIVTPIRSIYRDIIAQVTLCCGHSACVELDWTARSPADSRRRRSVGFETVGDSEPRLAKPKWKRPFVRNCLGGRRAANDAFAQTNAATRGSRACPSRARLPATTMRGRNFAPNDFRLLPAKPIDLAIVAEPNARNVPKAGSAPWSEMMIYKILDGAKSARQTRPHGLFPRTTPI
jgi:hypothetical protein